VDVARICWIWIDGAHRIDGSDGLDRRRVDSHWADRTDGRHRGHRADGTHRLDGHNGPDWIDWINRRRIHSDGPDGHHWYDGHHRSGGSGRLCGVHRRDGGHWTSGGTDRPNGAHRIYGGYRIYGRCIDGHRDDGADRIGRIDWR
jgi:hypothetical protein